MLENYIECFFFPANGKMKTIEDAINEKGIEKETIFLEQQLLKKRVPTDSG